MGIVQWFDDHQLPCFYHQVLGFECPFCGFQGAFVLLLKGEPAESLSLFPALIPTLILLAMIASRLFFRKPGMRVLKWSLLADLALVMGSWLARLLT